MDITVFIDESGTTPNKNNAYFVIGLLFTDNAQFVKNVFKKSRLKIIDKIPKLKKLLKDNGEIKGSAIGETKKQPIYEKLVEKCEEHFELGIIVLDLNMCEERLKNNSSRAFNYLIKRYLETYFARYSKFKDFKTINIIADERNVATGAKYVLEEYLNIELNIVNDFCENNIGVKYSNSNGFLLLQLIDFIVNTYFRNIQKHNKESEQNIQILQKVLCNKSIYKFPL